MDCLSDHAITGNDGNGLGLDDFRAGQASSNYKNAQHKSGKSHFFSPLNFEKKPAWKGRGD